MNLNPKIILEAFAEREHATGDVDALLGTYIGKERAMLALKLIAVLAENVVGLMPAPKHRDGAVIAAMAMAWLGAIAQWRKSDTKTTDDDLLSSAFARVVALEKYTWLDTVNLHGDITTEEKARIVDRAQMSMAECMAILGASLTALARNAPVPRQISGAALLTTANKLAEIAKEIYPFEKALRAKGGASEVEAALRRAGFDIEKLRAQGLDISILEV